MKLRILLINIPHRLLTIRQNKTNLLITISIGHHSVAKPNREEIKTLFLDKFWLIIHTKLPPRALYFVGLQRIANLHLFLNTI
jgi:hypothetical protein